MDRRHMQLSHGRCRSPIAPVIVLVGLCLGLRAWTQAAMAMPAQQPPLDHAGHGGGTDYGYSGSHDHDHLHGHGHGDGHGSSGAEVAVACTLLGGIIWIMGTFYLVNHEDDDIRRYSWIVISNTVSIFAAILSYQGLDDLADHALEDFLKGRLPGAARDAAIVVMDCLKFVACFAVMQRCIAKLAHHEHAHHEHAHHGGEDAEHSKDQEQHLEEHERSLKCWTTLLAHVVGFSALDAFSGMQALGAFRQGATVSLLPVLVLGAALFGLFRLADWARSRAGAEGGDEEAEEAENEIAAFSLSFLLVHVVRFLIVGGASVDGSEATGRTDVFQCVALLFLAALVFCAAMYVSCLFLHEEDKHGIEHESFSGLDPIGIYMERWCFIIFETCGMSLAWCLLFATKWTTSYVFELQGNSFSMHSPILGACVALFTAMLAFVVIFLLDKVADNLRGEAALMEKVMRVIIKSLSVLIGFGWEQAFHCGVVVVAEHLVPQQSGYQSLILKIFMQISVVVIVVPAWKRHILKTVLELQEEHEHAHAGHCSNHDSPSGHQH